MSVDCPNEHQQFLTPELAEGAAADAANKQRYGWLMRAKTGEGEGPRLWQEIDSVHAAIDQACQELGIPHGDERIHGYQVIAEERYRIAKTDEALTSPSAICSLRATREQLEPWVQKVAALKGEAA